MSTVSEDRNAETVAGNFEAIAGWLAGNALTAYGRRGEVFVSQLRDGAAFTREQQGELDKRDDRIRELEALLGLSRSEPCGMGMDPGRRPAAAG